MKFGKKRIVAFLLTLIMLLQVLAEPVSAKKSQVKAGEDIESVMSNDGDDEYYNQDQEGLQGIIEEEIYDEERKEPDISDENLDVEGLREDKSESLENEIIPEEYKEDFESLSAGEYKIIQKPKTDYEIGEKIDLRGIRILARTYDDEFKIYEDSDVISETDIHGSDLPIYYYDKLFDKDYIKNESEEFKKELGKYLSEKEIKEKKAEINFELKDIDTVKFDIDLTNDGLNLSPKELFNALRAEENSMQILFINNMTLAEEEKLDYSNLQILAKDDKGKLEIIDKDQVSIDDKKVKEDLEEYKENKDKIKQPFQSEIVIKKDGYTDLHVPVTIVDKNDNITLLDKNHNIDIHTFSLERDENEAIYVVSLDLNDISDIKEIETTFKDKKTDKKDNISIDRIIKTDGNVEEDITLKDGKYRNISEKELKENPEDFEIGNPISLSKELQAGYKYVFFIKARQKDDKGIRISINARINDDIISKDIEVDAKKLNPIQNTPRLFTTFSTRNISSPDQLTIKKVDENSKPLANAKFKLKNSQGYEKILSTDGDGNLTFSNLNYGEYSLEETESPQGYKKNDAKATIIVNENGISARNIQGELFSKSTSKTKSSLSPFKTDPQYMEDPYYPDYMNVLSYADVKDPSSGNVKYYLMLHPKDLGGSGTNKDTRLLFYGDNLKVNDLKLYNIYPIDRQRVSNEINNHQAERFINSAGEVNRVRFLQSGTDENNYKIELSTNKRDPYLGKNIDKALRIPKERFANGGVNNWTFLIEIDAKVIDTNRQAILNFDWLTDTNTNREAMIRSQTNIKALTNNDLREVELTVINSKTNSEEGLGKFTITKKDKETSNLLEGAEFTLSKDGKVIKRESSNQEGKVSFDGLLEGEYRLEESKAPNGYKRLDDYWIIKVYDNGKTTAIKPPSTEEKILYQPANSGGGTSPGTGSSPGSVMDGLEFKTTNQAGEGRLAVNNIKFAYSPHRGRYANYEQLYRNFEYILPNAEGGLMVSFDIFIDEPVKAGDYFIVNTGRHLDNRGIYKENESTKFALKDDYGRVIAIGEDIGDDGKLTKYTFTAHAENSPTVKLHIEQLLVVDRYEVTNDGNIFPTINIAGQDVNVWEAEFKPGQLNNMTYLRNNGLRVFYPPYMTRRQTRMLGVVNEINHKENELTYVIYFNPNSKPGKRDNFNINNSNKNVTILPYNYLDGQGLGMVEFKGIRVYRISRNIDLPFSQAIDEQFLQNNGQDITSSLSISNPQGGYEFNLPTGNRDQYIAVVDGKFDKDTENNFYVSSKQGDRGDVGSINYVYNNRNRGRGEVLPPDYDPREPISNDPKEEDLEILNERQKEIRAEFIFKKTKIDKISPLKGARFILKGPSFNQVKESDENGYVKFTNLSPGEYTIEEEKAPEGYKKTDKKWELLVDNDGNMKVTGMELHGLDFIVTNEEEDTPMKIFFRKERMVEDSSSADNTIQSGKIKLRVSAPQYTTMPVNLGKYPGTEEKDQYLEIPALSGREGRATFFDLVIDLEKGYKKDQNGKKVIELPIPQNFPDGEYTIIELEAPGGYIRTNKEFKIKIDKTKKIISMGDKILFDASIKDDNDPSIDIFTIINGKSTYPSTGGKGPILFVIAGVSIMTLAYILYRKNKNEHRLK